MASAASMPSSQLGVGRAAEEEEEAAPPLLATAAALLAPGASGCAAHAGPAEGGWYPAGAAGLSSDEECWR